MRNIEDFIYWEKTSRETIDFKTIYVDIAGDLVAGLLLSQIIYWNLPNKKGESKLTTIRGKKLLVKKRSDWFDEIRITEKQYDRAIDILSKKRLVYVENHKSNFYEGSTVPHIELRNMWLLAHLNNQRRKAGLTKRKSLNKQRGIRRIDKKVNAIDTEITPEITAKNTTSNTPTLSEQLKELAEKNNIPYTEDVNQDRLFLNKLMQEIKNCTNEKILERAEQFFSISKRDKKPAWIYSMKFGFKFLKFKWDEIEMEYNQNKPQVMEFKKPQIKDNRKVSHEDFIAGLKAI